MKIIIKKNILDEIFEHAKKAYPQECCGIVLGNRDKGENITIKEVKETKNLSQDPLKYQMDPRDFLKVQRYASSNDLDIVGVYHSHPDHPPIPSKYDIESAWEDLFYLIVTVKKSKPDKIKSWVFKDSRKKFIETKIEILNNNIE